MEIKQIIQKEKIEDPLENKIILLSRAPYKTNKKVTSLVVCYKLPNSRAEVSDLIKAFKKYYNISIGIIDFKSLLIMCTNKVLHKKTINHSDIENLEGIINVKVA